MGTAPVITDKSLEQILSQIASFFIHIIFSLLIFVALFMFISFVNPTDLPAIITTLLTFLVPMVGAYLIHMRGVRTEGPNIWIAGVVWLLMVMVYVLELPTGPGKCEHCTAVSKIALTLFTMTEGSNLMNGEGRLWGTWPALAMIGYSVGAAMSLRRHIRD